jgi:hypothetical protein
VLEGVDSEDAALKAVEDAALEGVEDEVLERAACAGETLDEDETLDDGEVLSSTDTLEQFTSGQCKIYLSLLSGC